MFSFFLLFFNDLRREIAVILIRVIDQIHTAPPADVYPLSHPGYYVFMDGLERWRKEEGIQPPCSTAKDACFNSSLWTEKLIQPLFVGRGAAQIKPIADVEQIDRMRRAGLSWTAIQAMEEAALLLNERPLSDHRHLTQDL